MERDRKTLRALVQNSHLLPLLLCSDLTTRWVCPMQVCHTTGWASFPGLLQRPGSIGCLPGLSPQGREVFDLPLQVCFLCCCCHLIGSQEAKIWRALGGTSVAVRLYPRAQKSQASNRSPGKTDQAVEPGCSWFLVYFSPSSTWPFLEPHNPSVKFQFTEVRVASCQ